MQKRVEARRDGSAWKEGLPPFDLLSAGWTSSAAGLAVSREDCPASLLAVEALEQSQPHH